MGWLKLLAAFLRTGLIELLILGGLFYLTSEIIRSTAGIP